METLNEDCLLEIFKYLQLRDQVALLEVGDPFSKTVEAFWAKQYKVLRLNFFEQPLGDREFLRFLECICKTVEVVQFKFLTAEKFEILKTLTFRKARDFRFSQMRPYFMDDDDMLSLRKSFPHLRCFSPQGKFSGEHMELFQNLQELTLSYCEKLTQRNFKLIMETLELHKLKLNIFPNDTRFETFDLSGAIMHSLESIELNTFELYWFLMKPLPAIKELVVTNRFNPRQLFDVLLSIWQWEQFLSLEVCNVDNILTSCLDMHMNVERLTIVNDANAVPRNAHLYIWQMSALRMIRFKDCSLQIQDIESLLQAAVQVELFSITDCQFNGTELRVPVSDIMMERNRALTLNFYENTLNPLEANGISPTPVNLLILGQNVQFNVTHDRGPELCYEPLKLLYR